MILLLACADPRPLGCPADMAQVGQVCVDRYEASVGADGAARSVAGVLPTTALTWPQAVTACEKAGKHLCTDSEWLSNCHGASWPWGNEPPTPGRCALPAADGHGATALMPTGSYPACASPEGVYDLAGNAWEWMTPDPGSRAITAKRGGAWYIEGGSPCRGAAFDQHPTTFSGTIVARCCAPLTPQ